ncbi:MAG: transcriptional regulator [Cytophagales bacterium]|jgi:DNA-binding MarR family transcriptional regulator|nr:transcriptional regulator [Cytophagales bacterium]NOS56719.1 transcriptional regulator [Cyclobacteriaceae bacterium]MCA6386988.1 transcriptional regulator [Cytophagales bacterium]MCA6392250.1 transcriptional regulator [Cytophagales bacterium]MCA6396438.1 transcriptional regulator [Cytophagales bacterium]
MKNFFENLDKTLEHRTRLQITSVLVANDSYDFIALKELLDTTDGNLATHLKALEREKYISINKSFIDKKPNTRYKITERGRSAFKKHIDAMEELIKQQKK